MQTNIQFAAPLILLFFLITGCNLQEPMPENNSIQMLSPQLGVSLGNASSCIDCPGGCIIGFPFTQNDLDGNHPQGGYPVTLIRGNCKCESYGNGRWGWVVTGTSTSHCGQTGGPGSGSANTLGAAQTLWGFNCGGGGSGGGSGCTYNNWNDWVSQVYNFRQTNPNEPLGGGSWPQQWNVSVQPTSLQGPIRIALPGQSQAQALMSFRVYENGTKTVLAEFEATGEPSYNLDLSALPDGFYTIELSFEPGFNLSTSLAKVAS